MATETGLVKMFFFPFTGGGHQIPMIDIARVFASHGAASTIIATPSHALNFQNLITRAQSSGHPITIHTLPAEIRDATDITAGPMTDTFVLLQPLKTFLLRHPPDCIVIDMFHRWAGDLVDELRIPRIVFTGNGCFPRCVQENIRKYLNLENLTSDYEPFVVPNLPGKVELRKSQLPIFARKPSQFPDKMKDFEDKGFGTIINSFYELEPDYADYMRNELGKKAWIVGPVSLCNGSVEDKTQRGKLSTIDEQGCLKWLNSKEPHSVIYVCFGSLIRLPPQQLKEIAYGLEASGKSFVWVVGKIMKSSPKNKEEDDEDDVQTWLPEGFEERMKESNRGLILRGWAPQLLILEHGAIGGFVTHCGWNSTLEGVCAGVPMVTWPVTAE
ncbi:abscisate beta-glucosyltransferase-like [Arachis stenosperma]|uniref:abscisate beta-glucosyltransferase-like n=1 Tax=Arachis stenosperma TaxID=217475 RepID=UPI0025ACEA95|nr:abscisate beta-glucosyltransferase-like [Arachis stenosperma]